MNGKKNNIEELCQQGWELAEEENFSAALSKFKEALKGTYYSFDPKIPVFDLELFEGTSLETTPSQTSAACKGAWYCKVRMAEEAEENERWSHLVDAIDIMDLQRSVEIVETIQMNRETIGWEDTSELLEIEKISVQQLDIINKIIETKKRERAAGTVSYDEFSRRILELQEEKKKIAEQLRRQKLKIYSNWLSNQDELTRHSAYEEYYPGQRLREVITCEENFPNLGIIHYAIQPKTKELVIIFDIFDMQTDDEQPDEEDLAKHERKSFSPDILTELREKYNLALEQRDEHALKGIISELDKWFLPSRSLPVEYLVIVADQDMEWIPWELLGASKGMPLGVHYALVRAPSLDLFRLNLERRSRMEYIQGLTGYAKPSLVLFGNPTMDLPGTEDEVDEIENSAAQRQVKTEVFKGKAATTSEFEKIDPATDVIHLACHADFHQEDPMLSNLKLSDGNILPRVVTSKEYLHYPITVLNSCESGMVRATGGEVLGLIRGFMIAGSPTVVSTNWKVEDESARDLILKFYEELLGGKSAGLSLRNARKYLYDNEEKGRSLFDWAAYTLYGTPLWSLYGTPIEDRGNALWHLFQSISGPDEKLSWTIGNALADITQQEPDLFKDLLIEGLVNGYEDWDTSLVLGRLTWFANDGLINKHFYMKTLRSAQSELIEEDPDEASIPGENLSLIENALEELGKSNYTIPMATRSFIDPAIKSLLPDFEVKIGSDFNIFASNENTASILCKALDSEDTQILRAAARVLSSIMEFDYDYAKTPDPDSVFYRALEKALNNQDSTVRKIIYRSLEGNSDWIYSEDVIRLFRRTLNNPNAKVRKATIDLLESQVEYDSEEIPDKVNPDSTFYHLLGEAISSPDKEVREVAAQTLGYIVVELRDDMPEYTLQSPNSAFCSALKEALNSQDSDLRKWFAGEDWNRSILFSESVIKLFGQALANPDREVRRDIARVLSTAMCEIESFSYFAASVIEPNAGDDAVGNYINKIMKILLTTIQKAKHDPDEGVRTIIIEALELNDITIE